LIKLVFAISLRCFHEFITFLITFFNKNIHTRNKETTKIIYADLNYISVFWNWGIQKFSTYFCLIQEKLWTEKNLIFQQSAFERTFTPFKFKGAKSAELLECQLAINIVTFYRNNKFRFKPWDNPIKARNLVLKETNLVFNLLVVDYLNSNSNSTVVRSKLR